MSKQMLLALLVGLATCSSVHADAAITPSHAVTTVILHGRHVAVELATNEPDRERGLMMRTQLAADRGMLFVFPDTEQRWFWMKNTLIPLDILYFGADRKLVSMQLDVPPCNADPCATYPSDRPAHYVLELSAGAARHIGAHIGDVLKIVGMIGAVH